MNIHWHRRAAAQLHQVEEYVLRDFGKRIRQEFMDEVEQATLMLGLLASGILFLTSMNG